MDNNLNNVEFINKKNNMQRSTISITVLLGIILFLLLIIGYLIYTNLKKPDEIIVDNCKNTTNVEENKSEEQEVKEEEEKITINEEKFSEMLKLLPTLKGTNYLDYHLFQKKMLSKEEISSFNTSLEPTNFKEVFYVPYQVEITSKNTFLYLYIVIHDKATDSYYESSLDNDKPLEIALFDKRDKEIFQKYGGRYKITYVNGAFGYLLEKIEYISGKR